MPERECPKRESIRKRGKRIKKSHILPSVLCASRSPWTNSTTHLAPSSFGRAEELRASHRRCPRRLLHRPPLPHLCRPALFYTCNSCICRSKITFGRQFQPRTRMQRRTDDAIADKMTPPPANVPQGECPCQTTPLSIDPEE